MNASPILTPVRSRTASTVWPPPPSCLAAFRTGRACRPRPPDGPGHMESGWAGDCRWRRRRGRPATPRRSRRPFRCPGPLAASRARGRSREAIALTVVYWPNCMAGMTFFRPMAAVLSTPQRNFLDMATIIELPRPALGASRAPHPYHVGGTNRAENLCNIHKCLAILFITPYERSPALR